MESAHELVRGAAIGHAHHVDSNRVLIADRAQTQSHWTLEALAGGSRIDGAYDKLWLRLGGFEQMPRRLLSPYHGFSEAQFQTCQQLLESKYADWLP